MIFSTQILKSNNNSLFVKENKSIYEDKSLFVETLGYILNEGKQMDSLIAESYSQQIMYEGIASDILKSAIKKIDPIKILFKLLQSFIDLLNKIWKNFHTFMLDFANKNQVIKRYKTKLMNIENKVYFPEERYIYTNLGTTTSYTTFKNDLGKEYSSLILDLSKFRDYKTYESLVLAIEKIKQELDLSDTYFDKVRGEIVGTQNSIAKENFATELYKFFRNDGSPVSASNISPNEIKRITTEYIDFSKILRSIQKDKSDMEDEAKRLQKDIMSIKLENFVKDSIPEEVQRMFIRVLEDKAKRIKLTCDIYLQVFSAKLDAAKESYNQNNKILITACKTIIKEELQ